MSTSTITERRASSALPPLEAGDHLDQPTFHERYEAMPPGFRAELIGGVVIVPSPLRVDHGEYHGDINAWLWLYRARTPGARLRDNATAILDEESEPQPDSALVIDPALGGQTSINDKGYSVGPPELVVEIATSSAAYDLYEKRNDYERAGVGEYVVVLVLEEDIRWFALEGDKFTAIAADEKGVFRSRIFPGLWLDAPALFRGDAPAMLNALEAGLATPEHAAFVKRLAEAGA
ncbi:MAG: Uma2 family endonuclease [Planctomycetaceae bacterium]